MKWMIPINNLDAIQLRILDEIAENNDVTHWVSGYAGSGKTIVIAHAIERLVRKSRSSKICFLTYTHALKDLVHSGLSDTAKTKVIIQTIDAFSATRDKFDFILVDEIQDIKESDIERIFNRAKYVIAAGDPEQSIYLGRVDPNELKRLLGGAKKHTLKHINGLSLKTFQMATEILPTAKYIAGANLHGLGENAKVIKETNKKSEFLKVYKEATRISAVEQPCAILFPMHGQIYEFAKTIANDNGWGIPPEKVERGRITDYTDFNEFFELHDSPLRFLGSNNGSLPESDDSKIIYLMTYHSAKGLHFNNVFLPDLTSEVNLDAKWAHFSKEEHERRHFFVALTRCIENLYLSYHGQPHYLFEELPKECLQDFTPPRTSLFNKTKN